MNWTGGALGRSRSAKASLTAIQKAHFAKARATRPERVRVESPVIEIFGQRKASTKGNEKHVNGPVGIERDAHSKAIFERPWIEHHIQPNHDPRSTGRQDPPSGSTTHVDEHRAPSPIIISSRPTSPLSSHNQQEEASIRSHSRHSSPNSPKRIPDPLSNAIEIQRARLLETQDWVGISHTKPAKVAFTNSNDRDQIGKRRRLDSTNYHVEHHKRRCHARDRPKDDGVAVANDHLSQADISVRIGSAVDRRSTQDDRSRRSISKLDQVSSISDEMLLDDGFSHKSASSHNPFRLSHASTNIYADQLLRHQGRALTPSAFIDDPNEFATEHEIGQGRSDDARNNHERSYVNEATTDYPRSPATSEPQLVTRKPNGEHTPVRFAFENTPRLLSDVSRQRTTVKLIRESGSNGETPDNEAHMDKRNTASAPRFVGSRVKDSETLLKNVVIIQSGDNQNSLARLDDPRKIDPATIKQAQPSVSLMNNLHGLPDLRGETIAENEISIMDLPFKDKSTLDPDRISTDEEEGWKACVTQKRPNKLELPVRPSPDEGAPSLEEVAIYAAETQLTHVPPQDNHATNDEDEALWRSFVFGKGSVDQEWIIETQTEEQKLSTRQSRTAADMAKQTQTSMEAEVATSPIKKNAHLLEQSTSSSTPTSGVNKASQIALVSSTSQLTNSDEMLDSGRRPNLSSSLDDFSPVPNTMSTDRHQDPHTISSSNLAQVATSPLTTTDCHTGPTPVIGPSSLIAQASTAEAMPAQPSSDELAWSSSRLSQATSKPSVIFKKPARYVGQLASDPVEPIRLGVKQRSARKSNRGRDREGHPKTDTERALQWDLADERDELQEDDEIEDY